MISLGDLGLTKAQALAALFNHARTQGLGALHYRREHIMTEQEATRLLDQVGRDPFFDYLEGRVLKVEIGDQIDERLYDRDNGEGAALQALTSAATSPRATTP